MSGLLLLSPLLLRFVTAIVLLFCWKHIRVQRLVSIAGEILSVIAAAFIWYAVVSHGPGSMQAGGWMAPYGITLIIDRLSAFLLLITAIIGWGVSLFAAGSMLNSRLRFGFYPIYHLLLLGISGAFMAGDIFHLYVWFEVMIIGSFVLLTLGGERSQIEGAVKYFALNFLASIIFLTALAVLYGLTGTLNMADLAMKLPLVQQRSLVDVCAFLFFVAFGIKAAVFPLYFWLPAAYHTPPPAVTAIFGGLLTKVGVYAMLRVFTLMFPWDAFIQGLLVTIAVLTILTGAFGALTKRHLVKSLAWLIVCHVGFMLAGLATHNQAAIAGAIFYMAHDMLVKTGLFLFAGISYRLLATHVYSKAGGLMTNHPGWSFLFAIPLFSVVGIPPLSGFWPKIALLSGMREAGQWLLFVMVLVGSLATLAVVARIWLAFFWKTPPGEKVADFKYLHQYPLVKQRAMLAGLVLLALSSLAIVLLSPQLYAQCELMAAELLQPAGYLEVVMPSIKGGKP